jgi:hypothetical protein
MCMKLQKKIIFVGKNYNGFWSNVVSHFFFGYVLP